MGFKGWVPLSCTAVDENDTLKCLHLAGVTWGKHSVTRGSIKGQGNIYWYIYRWCYYSWQRHCGPLHPTFSPSYTYIPNIQRNIITDTDAETCAQKCREQTHKRERSHSDRHTGKNTDGLKPKYPPTGTHICAVTVQLQHARGVALWWKAGQTVLPRKNARTQDETTKATKTNKHRTRWDKLHDQWGAIDRHMLSGMSLQQGLRQHWFGEIASIVKNMADSSTEGSSINIQRTHKHLPTSSIWYHIPATTLAQKLHRPRGICTSCVVSTVGVCGKSVLKI